MAKIIDGKQISLDIKNELKEKVAKRIPQHAQSLLLRNEDAGPIYPLRISDGSDKIRKSQRVQRPEQPDRPLYGPTVPDPLRHDGQGDTYLF